jgi:integration host factor subunit alpha
MARKTITRADLCEAVYQKVGLSRTESATLVELVLKEITDCLERGETVKLSSFGSFVVRKKGQRVGRNPKTGKEVPISPRRVMVFKPSAILKQRINVGPNGGGDSCCGADGWNAGSGRLTGGGIDGLVRNRSSRITAELSGSSSDSSAFAGA